jgi:predicted dehydrogenase
VKQVTQRARDGKILVRDVPPPALRPGFVRVDTRYSLISAGTERSKVELGGKSLLQKARARPDLVKKVVDKARVEGVRSACEATRDRLASLSAIGNSSAGVVLGVGTGVQGLAPGDRVACAGGGFANHADVVTVPRNLVAHVSDSVPLEAAAYATLGAIALHGVRRAEVGVGERIGVIGLGLVGQLAVRILQASGCEAIGIDLDPAAVELAADAGARAYHRGDPALENHVLAATESLGLDSLLICAASTSSDPLALAARLARDRGRIVVVGTVPIEVERALLYEKELELRLSRSYGPGRYDREYEERARDLPAGYVRWTEQRNIQAFVDLLAAGRVDVAPLTTHRFPVERAEEAYAVLTDGGGRARAFGILLEYDESAPLDQVPAKGASRVPARRRKDRVRVGLVGAGSFARGTILPALKDGGADLVAVTTERGLTAADVSQRFGFARAAASAEELLEAEDLDAVVIATRHGSHAALTAATLRAGKAVFVEKPLALSEADLAEVEAELVPGAVLMVGFNRRFAPLAERLRHELDSATDLVLQARVNAGPLPSDHWLHDPGEGGGRLLGEGCHFVDLLAHIAGSVVVSAHALAVRQPERPLECSDAIAATLRFRSGAVAGLLYAGGGDTRLPKERIEAFGGGLSAVLDDFRRLELYRRGRRDVIKKAQDKGHRGEFERFLEAAAGRAEAPEPGTYLASTRATLALAESLRTGMPVELP